MTDRTFGKQGFWVVLSLLVVQALGQGVAMALVFRLAWLGQEGAGGTLAQIAWLLLILLCLTLLILFWMVARRWREGILAGPEVGKTAYMDLWSEAGRRMELQEDEDWEEPEQRDRDEHEEDEDEEDY